MEKRFYSNGKLLLTGEYAVLDGALCLAVPTVFGQSLAVATGVPGEISWKSTDEKGEVWFEDTFTIGSDIRGNRGNPVSDRLSDLLRTAKQLNPGFLKNGDGYGVTAGLGFPRDWGLGSSSTLVSNIAEWAEVDPYELLWRTFSGSGYDIACARHNTPLFYRIDGHCPEVRASDFSPSFGEHLFFVHLNRKQDSREGIKRYKKTRTGKSRAIGEISEITEQLARCTSLEDFETLMALHEKIISSLVQLPPVQETLFPDYTGQVKSLGAWGGDFVMVTAHTHPDEYFKNKGYTTVIPYGEMVLGTGQGV